MLVTVVIVSFVLGCVATLLAQFWFVRRWLSYRPSLYPPYKEQHHKIQLPQALAKSFSSFCQQRPTSGGKDTFVKHEGAGKSPPTKDGDLNLILNVISHFLFAELKDTARVRRWMSRKLNVEFEEMLSSTTGKLMNQIQVRDFSLGENFPIVEGIDLKDVKFSKDKDTIERLDVSLDIDYTGGFSLTLDVDVIFGAWAYLFVKVSRLSGKARLQLSRTPYTHWSFSFYDEPCMEFEVDSRFNGRPIQQISSLVINQIKRMIRKKHILPSYKMRCKPLFHKPEESYVNPDISFHGNKLGRGQLTVKVLRCSRIQELSRDSKLYCTLSVDKEEMEEVWRKSWQTLHLTLKITPNVQLGLILKDQLSGEKTEKKRVVVDSITPESPAARSGLRKGDIIEYINNVRVLSFKHATKQLRNATENVPLMVKRHQSRFNLEDGQQFNDADIELEVEEQEPLDGDKEDLQDFVNIQFKDSSAGNSSSKNVSSNNSTTTTLKTEMPPSTGPLSGTGKLSEKVSRRIQSGKRKILRMGGAAGGNVPENGVESGSGDDVEGSDTNWITAEKRAGSGDRRASSTDSRTGLADGSSGTVLRDGQRDGVHSETASPQKHLKEGKRQRAHSDTSLNRTSDSDSASLLSDLGYYGYQAQERRAGEVITRELEYSKDTLEWNEEFVFDCKEDDQFVNICVWCKMLQADRSLKQVSNARQTDAQTRNTPPTDAEPPFYNFTTKIGYASIPLSDIAAGCLLTLQGDSQYTVYLQSPEETITATRAKLPYSSHAGFDKTICHGDITLSFLHQPFKAVEKTERKLIINNILNPQPTKLRADTAPKQSFNGQHDFKVCHFQSGTYCDFCGKKIWLKGGLQCDICSMVCHKKCVEKCCLQTKCSSDGPKNAMKPGEAWQAPVRGRAGTTADLDRDEKDGKVAASGGGSGKFWKNFRNKDQPQPSLPLNIPNKGMASKMSPSASPSRSPMRSPSPFSNILSSADAHLNLGPRKIPSNKSLTGMDKMEEDSDEEVTLRYRQSSYSLDDHIVIEAKEKGKELYSNLSLPERKKTLDEMVTKLQDTIDKESEYKSELIRNLNDSSDSDQKRIISQHLDKCDEKMDALMMMMVHYCAGLQHCLDQEEAHKRLLDLEQETADITEDSGIQFIVTDTNLVQ